MDTFYSRPLLNWLLARIPSQLPEHLAFLIQQLPEHIALWAEVVLRFLN
jgi:hypothetical protein